MTFLPDRPSSTLVPAPAPHLPQLFGLEGGASRPAPARWQQIATALYRHRLLAAGILAGCLLLALAASLLIRPRYQASGTIILDRPETSERVAQLTPATYAPTDEDREIQTELNMLGSRAVALKVIQTLHLEQSDPAIARAIAAARRSAAREGKTLSPAEQDRLAAGMFADQLSMTPDKLSRMVRVSYRSENPRIAAAAVNEAIQSFIQFGLASRAEEGQQALQWLQQRLQEAHQTLVTQQQDLVHFQAANAYAPLFLPGAQQSALLSELEDASRAMGTAEAEQIAAQAWRHVDVAALGQLPSELRSPALDGAVANVNTAQANLNRLVTVYRPDFPAVVEARNEVQQARTRLASLEKQVEAGLEQRYQAARQRRDRTAALLANLNHAAAGQSGVQLKYQMLMQQEQAQQQLYDTLQTRQSEIELAATLTTSNVRILDRALVPTVPLYPRMPLNLGLGLALGLVLAAAAAIGRERMAQQVVSPDQLSEPFGVTPGVLAVVPDHGRLLQASTAGDGQGLSQMAENYQRLAAHLVARHTPPTSWVVTSPNPGEGKTETACQLALALGRAGWRTLLVDADLQRPDCHRFFGLDNRRGLAAVLRGENAAPVTVAPNLDLLPGEANNSEPLQPRRLAELLKQWRQQYDYVLLDTPPAGGHGEAMTLASYAGGVLLVVRWGATRSDEAQQLLAEWARSGVEVVGTVLNGADPSAPALRAYRRHPGYSRRLAA